MILITRLCPMCGVFPSLVPPPPRLLLCLTFRGSISRLILLCLLSEGSKPLRGFVLVMCISCGAASVSLRRRGLLGGQQCVGQRQPPSVFRRQNQAALHARRHGFHCKHLRTTSLVFKLRLTYVQSSLSQQKSLRIHLTMHNLLR